MSDRIQDDGRTRILQAAADLLSEGGSEAVTTRRVAAAAGVQPPAIYRHFGDKDGLLEAVAEHVYAAFVAAKQAGAADDPVDGLAEGWDAAVEFGLANPYLYQVMWDDARGAGLARTLDEGMRVLDERLHRVAVAGRLRLDARLAVAVIQASARGAVLTWLATPEADRDPQLLRVMRESMITAVTTDEPANDEPGLAGAARTLRAMVPAQTVLRPAEVALLTDWLDRLTAATTDPPEMS